MITRQQRNKFAKPIVAAACAAVLVLSVPRASAAATPRTERTVSAERVREALSRRPLRTLEGGTLKFEALSGNVVVVHFWATWCRTCLRELPALNALDAELAPSGGRVLAISIDSDVAKVKRFAREHGLTLPIITDGPAGIAHQLDLGVLPYSVVLDRGGLLAFATAGTGEDALLRLSKTARRLVVDQPWVSTASQGGTR